jgi:hypothetical protein
LKKYNPTHVYSNGTKYSYLVTFADKDITYLYYGVQYAKKSNPINLGKNYFTSSNKVKNLIKRFGLENFTFQVRKVFEDHWSVDDLLDFEFNCIKFLKTKYPDRCINQYRRGTNNSENPHLKGALHPAYGVSNKRGLKLIHNKETQFQSKVSPQELQSYLDKGWVLGCNDATRAIHKERARKNKESGNWINPMSNPESLKKMAATRKEQSNNGTWTPPMKGITGKDNPRYGSKQTDNQKQKAAEANQRNWIIINPDGKEYSVTNLRKFCRDNDLSNSNMCSVSTGKLNHYKGWKCKRED